MPTKSKRASGKRELVNTGKEKRFVRRNSKGQFNEVENVGRSLSADRRHKAKTKVKSGYGRSGRSLRGSRDFLSADGELLSVAARSAAYTTITCNRPPRSPSPRPSPQGKWERKNSALIRLRHLLPRGRARGEGEQSATSRGYIDVATLTVSFLRRRASVPPPVSYRSTMEAIGRKCAKLEALLIQRTLFFKERSQ